MTKWIELYFFFVCTNATATQDPAIDASKTDKFIPFRFSHRNWSKLYNIIYNLYNISDIVTLLL